MVQAMVIISYFKGSEMGVLLKKMISGRRGLSLSMSKLLWLLERCRPVNGSESKQTFELPGCKRRLNQMCDGIVAVPV